MNRPSPASFTSARQEQHAETARPGPAKGAAARLRAWWSALAGVTGAVVGPYVLDAVGVHAPLARGIALGTASHGIATARAFAEGEVAGSFASLAMVLNAVLTAAVVPPLVRLIGLA